MQSKSSEGYVPKVRLKPLVDEHVTCSKLPWGEQATTAIVTFHVPGKKIQFLANWRIKRPATVFKPGKVISCPGKDLIRKTAPPRLRILLIGTAETTTGIMSTPVLPATAEKKNGETAVQIKLIPELSRITTIQPAQRYPWKHVEPVASPWKITPLTATGRQVFRPILIDKQKLVKQLKTSHLRLVELEKQLVDERNELEEEKEELSYQIEQLLTKNTKLRQDFRYFQEKMDRKPVLDQLERSKELARQFLPVLDSYERARQIIKCRTLQTKSKSVSRVILDELDGHLAIIQDQLVETLQLEEIIPEKGTQFNFHLHEALGREPSDQQENTIISVVRKGYSLFEFKTTIRPCEVIVSSGEIPATTGSRTGLIKRSLQALKARIGR